MRHPVVVAKWLTTLGHLTDSRVIAGLGPGSSRADYTAVGVDFEQRWARFDEAFDTISALIRGGQAPAGTFYDASQVRLDPLPAKAPELWFATWGSDRRLRALAQRADGWFASGYNTTPAEFTDARGRLDGHLLACGRDPTAVPDAIATMWLYVTSDDRERDRVLGDVLAPLLRRAPLPGCRSDHTLLRLYANAGAGQILLWPIEEPTGQLHMFADLVRPHIPR